jgi:hypothetical protein
MSNYQNRSLFINRGIAVKDYAYVENINSEFRQSMEDGIVLIKRIFYR